MKCAHLSTDNGETDLDCGGWSLCGPCGSGDSCSYDPHSSLPRQCVDGVVCYRDVCVPTFCENVTLDYNESDVDCGGSCDDCAEGDLCAGNDFNCQSNVCLTPPVHPFETSEPPRCAPDRCANGLPDGDETDVDCGGSCRTCALNEACMVDLDCQSFWCDSTTSTCRPPSCADAQQNGTETAPTARRAPDGQSRYMQVASPMHLMNAVLAQNSDQLIAQHCVCSQPPSEAGPQTHSRTPGSQNFCFTS